MTKGRIAAAVLIVMLVAVKSTADMACTTVTAPGMTGWKQPGIKMKLDTEVETEYSDNIFHLKESQKTSLINQDPGDVTSGRYKDMDTVWDVMMTSKLKFAAGWDSPLGGKLDVASGIYYHAYTRNTAKSYPEFRIDMAHTIGENGELCLELKYLNNVFRKNDLSEVDDANGNGNITKEERVYAPPVYEEFEGTIAYACTLRKDKDLPLSRVDLETFSGWGYRQYNDDFHNRDRRSVFAGLAVDLAFLSKLSLKTIYKFENITSPGNRELVLYDETINSTDVNDDGEIRCNAPLWTPVDRSCRRHAIEIIPSFDLTDNYSFFLGYKFRTTTYTSGNPLDIKCHDQTAVRVQLEAGMTYAFTKMWHMEAAFRRTVGDSEEEDDFTENRIAVEVKYRLKSKLKKAESIRDSKATNLK